MHPRQRFLWALAALALGAAPLHAQPVAPLEAEIALAMPLSGPLAALGRDTLRGAQLAIDDAHARGARAGGRTLRLTVSEYDDAADVERGVLAANWIAISPAVAVIGHLNSGVSIPASDVYRRARVAQVTPASTNPQLTEREVDTVFRLPPNDAASARRLGQFAAERLRVRRAVAVLDESFYAKVITENAAGGLLAGGGQLLDAIEVDEDETRYADVIEAVRRLKPDALIFGGMDEAAVRLLAALSAANVKLTILGGDGLCTGELMDATGGTDVPVTCYVPAADTPARFAERFRARYGADPDEYAAAGYDAASVVIAAIERAGSAEREAVLAALRATDLKGLTFRIRFDARGDAPASPTRVYTLRRGERRLERTLP